MTPTSRAALGRLLRAPAPLLIAGALSLMPLATLLLATPAAAADLATLKAHAQELQQPDADRNPFKRPLRLDSAEADNHLRGTIYAIVDHPFSRVGSALQAPGNWCEILMLHINTKYCAVQPAAAGGDATVAVSVGRKYDQPLEDAQKVAFVFRVAQATPDYLDVRMSAAEGPLSTSDYRIALQAIPAAGNKTFVQLDYSYAYGTAARIAMQTYLITIGRGKVGFTPKDGSANVAAGDKPEPIGGVRGVVERNTMRYYLIDAFLDSLVLPAAQQRDRRLTDWFDATEQYAQQLHEVDRNDYLKMKRSEFQRLQAGGE